MKRCFGYVVVLALIGSGMGMPDTEAGVFQLFRKAAVNIGRELGGDAAETGSANGSKALRHRPVGESGDSVVRELGGEVLEGGSRAADELGDTGRIIVDRLGKDGITLLKRSRDDIVPLVRRYGVEAADVCVKHPGVGKQLVEEFGEAGIRVGKRLETDEVIRLCRMMNRTPPGKGRMMLLERVKRQGGRAIRVVERHPKTVIGGAATGYLLTHPQQLGQLTSEGVTGLLKGVGIDPARSPIAGMVVVGSLAFILMGPVYLYGYLRYRRKRT